MDDRLEELYALEPRVEGDTLTASLRDFARACHARLGVEQAKPNPDTAVIGGFCEAIRLVREHDRLWHSSLARDAENAQTIASLREELARVRGERGELVALCRMLAEVGRIGSEHASLAAKLGIFLDAVPSRAPEEPSPPRSRFDCVHELAENLARPDTRGEER